MMDWEEMILARQEERDEDYDDDARVECNRPLNEVYPQLFKNTSGRVMNGQK